MILSIVYVALGLLLLFAGGDALVRGATQMAARLGVSKAIIGLTIVAAGTSTPELVVSLKAALAESTGVAVGNVVGSNIFNVAAILGVAALISPLRIEGSTCRFEWPIMLLSSCQLVLLARDGEIDRFEGAFFLLGIVLFVAYMVRVARTGLAKEERAQLEATASGSKEPIGWGASIALVVGGSGVLVLGAHSLVTGSVSIAKAAGVSETVIGLTVVAAGTSLPELSASVLASYRGQNDIAVANVLGSNIFNILGILGTTAVVHPLPIPPVVLERDAWWMLGFSVALFPLMRTGFRISRGEGGLLLGAFAAYLTLVLAL